ncbi:hypothetical protein NGRA_2200 [Nosema granulosis]|uniref:Uncharacterized protein n=1 Tax=Nosema granulosis TaxID=83296 RepID=A0A9P6KYP0_9MICR|nr:hypothetical protein NGRA_2200 [Nosema granulosis]
MKKRFGSASRSEISLTRFIELEVPKTRSEYLAMLKFATNIYERGIIKLQVLAQMVIQKVPSEIRALLYQKGLSAATWEQFIQAAEEMAIISFPEFFLSRVETNSMHQENRHRGGEWQDNSREWRRRGFFGRYEREYTLRYLRMNYGARYCILHGGGYHFTNECKMVKEMIKREI